MASDDFEVLAFKILSYLYRCMKVRLPTPQPRSRWLNLWRTFPIKERSFSSRPFSFLKTGR